MQLVVRAGDWNANARPQRLVREQDFSQFVSDALRGNRGQRAEDQCASSGARLLPRTPKTASALGGRRACDTGREPPNGWCALTCCKNWCESVGEPRQRVAIVRSSIVQVDGESDTSTDAAPLGTIDETSVSNAGSKP